MTRASADGRPATAPSGETTPSRGDGPLPEGQLVPEKERSPRLPHEHDESRHSQSSASPKHGPVGRQAYKDATGPQVDTDKGPVMDDVYNRSVAPEGRSDPPRK
jgi:hypothetical protein